MRRASRLLAALCGVVMSVGATIAFAQANTKLVTEEFMVPSSDPGIRLYVRTKHPQGSAGFTGGKILLYVHGATYPSETAFDLPLNGFSWMDYIAYRGYDVYLVDVRGYGKSDRPPEMSQAPDKNPPLVHAETAVSDVGSAVDYILKRRNATKLN